jgi:hypothetical protein
MTSAGQSYVIHSTLKNVFGRKPHLEVSLDDHFIVIRSLSQQARVSRGRGEKRIPINAIQAVQWHPPGKRLLGFIELTVAGGVERQSKFGSRTLDAARNENAITFSKADEPAFTWLRDTLLARISHSSVAPTVSHSSITTDLTRLADLRDRGALSDDEFQAQKARILNG